MALRPADERRATQWLLRAGVSDRCPACGDDPATWTFSDVFIALRRDPLSTELVPLPEAMVARICARCSYHMIFAAKPMDLVS